jgi:beta-alanine--pyruvate transaminase
MVSSKIYQSAMDNADAPIELFHGYTYSAHPIAVAAALATLDTYAEEGLFERGTALAPVLEAAVHGLSDNKHVKDIRNLGMVAGIELHARDGAVGARGVEVLNAAWEAGVMLRVTGDTIALSPPLIITEAEIERIVTTISDILDRIA